MDSAKRKVSDAGNQFLDRNGRYTVAGLSSDPLQRAIPSRGHIAADSLPGIRSKLFLEGTRSAFELNEFLIGLDYIP
ncbi:MAG: hypothetical protein KDK37_07130 [Leptospiraceae bacterium]|nr:hypothetical protein [Leptospiraceae bacterium]